MANRIDLNKWERKDIYNFFKNFTEPFFGVTVTIDCTNAYKYCKENLQSFFLYYLHKSLVAANSIESFKYRIINDEVIIFDKVNASATINRPNNTFGFSYINYFKDYTNFEKEAKKEIENVQNRKDLIPAVSGENVIHYSSIPWINFTSLSHARNFTFNDSCPKISFGKMTEQNGKKEMPMSVHVHHALLDGFHVGQYIDLFQKLMNEQ
ncbi:chloramphenicol acetyltransferase [Tenacibaculum sp. 190524A02b]|uniref:chloramphenicol acetyltransferase n=1 Tax=Tenacibaculum vairaonense TaxID=3137860 RepID=UPI0031FB256D